MSERRGAAAGRGFRARIAVVVWTAAVASVPSATWAGRAAVVRTDAFRLLSDGVAAYNRGEYALAVESLRQSASIALNSFRAYYYLGLALIADRRYAEAAEALTVALDLEPNHLHAHVARGDAFLRQGDTAEAMAEYHLALKLRADFPAALDGIGRVHEATADDERAIEFFARAIHSNRGFAEAYTHLGDLYLRNGRLQEAVRLLAEAVSIRPDYAPGLNRLALAYGRLGLASQAVATIRRAIELEPNAAAHRAALGRIQLGLDLVANAEQAFLQAQARDAGLPEAREGLAEVARRRGDYAEALRQLDAGLADPRLDARSRRSLAELRHRVEAEQGWFDTLQARVQGGAAGPEDHAALARLYAGRGVWATALEHQRSAPATVEAREMLAYLSFKAGHYREAHRLYEGLAAERPSTSLELNDGVTLALLGDDAGALEAYGRAIALEPRNAMAHLYRANALLRLGRQREAAEGFRSFLDLGGQDEDEERVRRILRQIAPESLPKEPPLVPELPPQPEPPEEGSSR